MFHFRIPGAGLARNIAKYVTASSSAAKAERGMAVVESLRRRRLPATCRTVRFAPAFEDDRQASDLANRCRWYFHGTGVEVRLQGHFPLQALPNSQPAFSSDSVTILFDDDNSPSDCVAHWRLERSRIARLWGTKAFVVDPRFYLFTECSEWLKLRNAFESAEGKQRGLDESRRVFAKFLDDSRSKDEAFLFTTGPSVDAARSRDYSERSLKIVCNSMVKNLDLLDHIQPDLITFTDDVFHFGPSLYAAKFREEFIQAMARYPKCLACIPSYAYDLMLSHYPQLAGRIIGIPMATSREFFVPRPGRFAVRSTENVLTFLMLPLASAVSQRIWILGADGRKPDENYFWKHSEKNQFGDLMWSVFECHPSFFDDNDYGAYYVRHSADFELQLVWMDRSGYEVRSLTPSHIPALRARQAAELLIPAQATS